MLGQPVPRALGTRQDRTGAPRQPSLPASSSMATQRSQPAPKKEPANTYLEAEAPGHPVQHASPSPPITEGTRSSPLSPPNPLPGSPLQPHTGL